MTRSRETTDKPLPQSASESDAAAFRDGLVEMIPNLRAFARSLCGKRDLADDLAQETLAKAWQARDRFQPGTNLKAWLFVILRNEFYSAHRRAKTVANYTLANSHLSEGMEAEQYAKLDLADLIRAFNQLPSEQKEALALTTGEFSYDEAAEICGCAVGTIKSRVSRARKQLQNLVEGNAGRLPDRGNREDDLADAFFNKINQSDAGKLPP
jgi:RNA polymerase sigma-70 factor, ECF subfamily